MLIIQIIIGVVIGGFILLNFGAVLGWAILLTAAVLGLILLGGAGYWLLNNIGYAVAIILFIGSIYFACKYHGMPDDAAMEEERQRRKRLGYDD